MKKSDVIPIRMLAQVGLFLTLAAVTGWATDSRGNSRTVPTLARLSFKDGLADNAVISIVQDRDGYLWFSTPNGATRYRQPKPSPPPVFVDAVVADQRYRRHRR